MEKFIQIACMPQAPDNPLFALTDKGRIFMLKQENGEHPRKWIALDLPQHDGMFFEDVTVLPRISA